MSNKYDILEFAMAKKMQEDLPKVLKILEEIKLNLEPFRFFKDCDHILHKVDDAIMHMQLELGISEVVVNKKGLIE